MIQRMERRQLTPNRVSVWGMLSILTGEGIQPRSQEASAAKLSVQVPGGPLVQGHACSGARTCSPLPESFTPRVHLHRRDWASHVASLRRWRVLKSR